MKSVIKPLLWLCVRSLSIFNVALILAMRASDGIISLRIKQAEFIGPLHIVEECRKIVDELTVESPELFKVLFEQETPIFCFVPEIDKGFVNARRFFVGAEFLAWKEAGIRACLVAAAYTVRAKLHHPFILISDNYNGGVLAADAAAQTSIWLRNHKQPVELIQYFPDTSLRHSSRAGRQ